MMEPKIDRGVTVGTFDGVHRGHQAVVSTLIGECRERGLSPLVITFEPHPLAVVAPDKKPVSLESTSDRVARLKSLGVDVEVIPFTETLRRTTVSEWLRILSRDYGARLLVAGYDNTFGSDGRGLGVADYARLASSLSMDVVAAPEVEGVSSSLVRQALAAGEVEDARRMLGRPFAVEGEVVKGRQLGRSLGFPTANVAVASGMALPAPGVYAADAVTSAGLRFRAVVNIGVAPTAGDSLPLTTEAHLIGFSGDLYGSTLRLEFLRRLRDERKFSSLDALKQQISHDVAQARELGRE